MYIHFLFYNFCLDMICGNKSSILSWFDIFFALGTASEWSLRRIFSAAMLEHIQSLSIDVQGLVTISHSGFISQFRLPRLRPPLFALSEVLG